MAVAADKMITTMRAFGVPVPDAKTAVAAYRSALAECPADLVARAFERATNGHRFGMRLPLPSELLDAVREELNERRRLTGRLTLMARAPIEAPPSRDVSAAEREAALAVLAQAKAILASPR